MIDLDPREVIFNGGQRCSTLEGHCDCGAHHETLSFAQAQQLYGDQFDVAVVALGWKPLTHYAGYRR